jgi:bacteriophage N4 adsorption protein B
MEVIEQICLVLAYVAAIGFLVSGLDDLFFDSLFLNYLLKNRKKPTISLKGLRLAPEQWVAVCVPAWQEGGVVDKMAEYSSRVVLYEKYDIFIGVYPNDPETNACVDKICADNPRIHKVTVPHPGPTCKADCLNWIYRGMRLNELPGVREYAVIAIHDAEDIVHPLALKVYNYFVAREYDMAQLPVFALEMPVLQYWTGNTYIDGFAELHTKDVFIRESIGGVVPSAGVGTAFGRKTLEHLAAANHGDPFLIGNLTEDYEIGIRIKRAGFRTGVVSYPVDRIVRRRQRDGTLGPPQTITELVAIREAFPATFRAAVRQRSRWILGISFQTWEQSGWAGTLPMRYTLLRDRRAPLTHVINMVGYLVLGFVLLEWLFRQTPWASQFYVRPLLVPDSWLWKIAIVDTWLLVYRGVQKIVSVYSIYSLKQALFSVPRVILDNVINFTATIRAARTYLAHKLFGTPFVWQKTTHVFPGESELSEYRKTIEDLLVEEGLATRDQIFQALKVEKSSSAPLCLLRLGLIDERQFTDVWAKHSGLGVRFINPFDIPDELLRRFPEKQSLELQAIPVEISAGHLVMAFREPPAPGQLEWLGRQIGVVVQPLLARPSSIAFARNRAYPRLVLAPSPVIAWSRRFQQAAGVESGVLLEALSSQYATHRSLPDMMVDMGMLSDAQARRVWAESLDCLPSEGEELSLNQELYHDIGSVFWWLHRMLPVGPRVICTGATPHPEAIDWLATRTQVRPEFVADLPSRIELAATRLGVNIDPDQVFYHYLYAKGILRREDLPDLATLRSIIAEPLPKWLQMQKLLTEEQLYPIFLEISRLPAATGWTPDEVVRLLPVLPSGFPAESGCYCLEATERGVRLGLAQLPSAHTLREIHDRLAGYPVFFQALSYPDAIQLRQLASESGPTSV